MTVGRLACLLDGRALTAVDITIVSRGPVRGRRVRGTSLSVFFRLSPLRRSRRGRLRYRLDADEFPDQEALMGEVGVVFKRCGCRNPVNGRRLDRGSPRLDERDHGTWYFACSALNVFGRAERMRRGGYPSPAAASRA